MRIRQSPARERACQGRVLGSRVPGNGGMACRAVIVHSWQSQSCAPPRSCAKSPSSAGCCGIHQQEPSPAERLHQSDMLMKEKRKDDGTQGTALDPRKCSSPWWGVSKVGTQDDAPPLPATSDPWMRSSKLAVGMILYEHIKVYVSKCTSVSTEADSCGG
ncbi:hypothetical protein TREES_T100002967 [Tupaia chinensis]|uniref:Uncharacterized protein n=1 Tax=Tupaia chinensis TaxID=246437 RepID=L9KRD9_TUPCH|nr:hypothetical protein TREES_T100002967 [Tupaia chinensis]